MTTSRGSMTRFPTFARGGWKSGRGSPLEVRTIPHVDIPNLPRLPERVGVPAPARYPSRPIPPVTLPRSIPASPATRTEHQRYPYQLATPFYPGLTPGPTMSLPVDSASQGWPTPLQLPLPQRLLDPVRVERKVQEEPSPDSGGYARLYRRRRRYPWLI